MWTPTPKLRVSEDWEAAIKEPQSSGMMVWTSYYIPATLKAIRMIEIVDDYAHDFH